MAKQLMHPSGLFGRYVMGRVLNRLTSHHCSLVREELAVGAKDRVLEVGFGGGALLAQLCQEAPEGFVAGVDVSDEMLAAVKRRLRSRIASGQLAVRHASVESLPFGDAEFDKACTVNTTYFWQDLAAGLSELRRVLRRDGRLVLGFVSADDMVRDGLDRHGFACHSPEQLTAAVAAASFRVRRLRSGSDSRGTFHVLAAERAG